MYGITTQAKTLIDSVTFADAIHALEAQAKLSRLQNLEIIWTYSDANESNREYAAEGEKVMGELKALVETNGTKVA